MTNENLPLADPGPEPKILDFWDRSNPRSVVNLMPRHVAECMELAAKNRPELFQMDERQLRRKLSPTPTDNRMRLAFWLEYDRAQAAQTRHMNMARIYEGVSSREFFETFYVTKPERVAWLLCHPHSYEVIMSEALAYGVERIREILEMPFIDKKGKIDHRTMEMVLKTVALLDVRVKGATIQRVEQKNLNVHVGTGGKDVTQALLGNSMDEIEARLKYLEKKERAALHLPEPEPETIVCTVSSQNEGHSGE